jgi:hypothetical protein
MVYAVSAIGGLLLVGYCISRINANREAKKSVQTLFNTKSQLSKTGQDYTGA